MTSLFSLLSFLLMKKTGDVYGDAVSAMNPFSSSSARNFFSVCVSSFVSGYTLQFSCSGAPVKVRSHISHLFPNRCVWEKARQVTIVLDRSLHVQYPVPSQVCC